MIFPCDAPKALDNIAMLTVISAPMKGSSYQPEKRLTPGSSIRPRGLSGNKCCIKALRFESDLVGLIEQNRRRSMATSRIWRLKIDQSRPEYEMHECSSYFLTAPFGPGRGAN
jgi:hypothetical protein